MSNYLKVYWMDQWNGSSFTNYQSIFYLAEKNPTWSNGIVYTFSQADNYEYTIGTRDYGLIVRPKGTNQQYFFDGSTLTAIVGNSDVNLFNGANAIIGNFNRNGPFLYSDNYYYFYGYDKNGLFGIFRSSDRITWTPLDNSNRPAGEIFCQWDGISSTIQLVINNSPSTDQCQLMEFVLDGAGGGSYTSAHDSHTISGGTSRFFLPEVVGLSNGDVVVPYGVVTAFPNVNNYLAYFNNSSNTWTDGYEIDTNISGTHARLCSMIGEGSARVHIVYGKQSNNVIFNPNEPTHYYRSFDVSSKTFNAIHTFDDLSWFPCVGSTQSSFWSGIIIGDNIYYGFKHYYDEQSGVRPGVATGAGLSAPTWTYEDAAVDNNFGTDVGCLIAYGVTSAPDTGWRAYAVEH